MFNRLTTFTKYPFTVQKERQKSYDHCHSFWTVNHTQENERLYPSTTDNINLPDVNPSISKQELTEKSFESQCYDRFPTQKITSGFFSRQAVVKRARRFLNIVLITIKIINTPDTAPHIKKPIPEPHFSVIIPAKRFPIGVVPAKANE